MPKPTQFEKAMLVAQVAAGIKADSQSWRDFEHEAVSGQSWDQWVLAKARKQAFEIWRESE